MEVIDQLKCRFRSWTLWVPYALLFCGVSLSVAATQWVATDANTRARDEFVTEASETRQRIQVRLNSYMQLLEAAAALLRANNEINAREFAGFVSRLDVRAAYPALEGVGYVQHVRRDDVAHFLKLIRLDGARSLRIWPEGRRPEYYPQIFLEPADETTRQAIGFDLSVDPVMLATMERARDTGRPAATTDGAIVRVAEGPSPSGFAVFLPVYRTNASIATVQQRQRALVGFVYGPFNADALQRELSLAVSPAVAFRLFPAIERTAPLLGSNASAPDRPRFTSAQSVDVAGQQWHLDVRSMQSDAVGLPLVARGCITAGLLISLMVFAVTRAQAASWAAHARHASELQEYAAALRRSDTELRHAVALEREARAIAQTADRAKDEFLAVLSHELRTPLNAVLGWTAMLRQGAVAKERQAAALEVIARNARLQAQLVEDLLDVSRIVAGTLRIERSVVTVTPIVEAALESLRPVAHAKHIDLVVSMPDEEASIYADATRVQQVVSNVLGNAIKFTPEGGRVFLELAYGERNVVMRVRDTGIGIAPEFLPHVFEPFRQADTSTTRVHGGVGLGLAIVRRLVEMHGGSVEAHSDPQSRGALFTVCLPLDDVASEHSSAGAGAAAKLDAHGPRGHVDVERISMASIGADRREAVPLLV